MRHRTKLVFAAAVVAVSIACMATAAVAGASTAQIGPFEYVIHSCDASTSGEGRGSAGWERRGGAGGAVHVETCPDGGIGFDLTADLNLGDDIRWVFSPHGELKISGATLLVTGGDSDSGVVYSISACEACAPLQSINVPGAGGPLAPQRFDFAPASGFVVTGRCTRPVCARTDGLRFKNVKLTMYDDKPPALGWIWPLLRLSSEGEVLARARFDDWNRPDEFGVDVVAADDGVGFGNGDLLVDGIPVLPLSGACWLLPYRDLGRAPPCPASSDRFNGSLHNSGIADGWHTLQVRLEDALGNSHVVGRTEFGIDGTAPAEPADFRVTGASPSGWHASAVVTIDWSAPPPDTGSGIVGTHYDVDPLGPGQIDPAEQVRWTAIHRIADLVLPSDGAWRVDVWYEDAVGNRSPRHHEYINVDGSLPSPPKLRANPTINRAQLIAPYFQLVDAPEPDPALESGVCGYVLSASSDPESGVIDSEPRPVSRGGLPVPANLSTGLNFIHVRAVSCSGRRSLASTTRLVVDDTPPKLTIESSSGDEWSRFPVEIRISAVDDLSRVDRVFYSVDGSQAVAVVGSTVALTLSDGVHELNYGAVDAAGNAATTLFRAVKVDASPPEAWLEASDASNPGFIEATAEDRVSGISVAWLQYRRVDGSADSDDQTWRSFGRPARPQRFGGVSVDLSAHLPEEQMADGVYAIRVVALDVAGNETQTGRSRTDGEVTLVTLPVRTRPVLTSGVARITSRCFTVSGRTCSKRARCAGAAGRCVRRLVTDRPGARSSRELAYGAQAAVVGELRSKSGDPIANARLKLYIARKGSRMEAGGEVTTGVDGEYEYRVPAGTSRSFIVRYVEPGGSGYVDAATVTLTIRSGVSIRPLRNRVRTGSVITIDGRLLSAGADIPDGGKLVTIEQFDARGRVLAVKNVYARLDGRFAAGFPAPSIGRRSAKVSFRATVPTDAAWPFAAGVSPRRVVEVRR